MNWLSSTTTSHPRSTSSLAATGAIALITAGAIRPTILGTLDGMIPGILLSTVLGITASGTVPGTITRGIGVIVPGIMTHGIGAGMATAGHGTIGLGTIAMLPIVTTPPGMWTPVFDPTDTVPAWPPIAIAVAVWMQLPAIAMPSRPVVSVAHAMRPWATWDRAVAAVADMPPLVAAT